ALRGQALNQFDRNRVRRELAGRDPLPTGGPMPTTPRAYGWRPDPHDSRDYRLADHVALPAVAALPPRVDLRETGHLASPFSDQGQLGSCTANAIAGALR